MLDEDVLEVELENEEETTGDDDSDLMSACTLVLFRFRLFMIVLRWACSCFSLMSMLHGMVVVVVVDAAIVGGGGAARGDID